MVVGDRCYASNGDVMRVTGVSSSIIILRQQNVSSTSAAPTREYVEGWAVKRCHSYFNERT